LLARPHFSSSLAVALNITLEDNAALRAKLSTYALPERMYIKVPAPANGGYPTNYSTTLFFATFYARLPSTFFFFFFFLFEQ
jgi:hypothetical protein